jgi:cobalamin biosynthesis protein CobT
LEKKRAARAAKAAAKDARANQPLDQESSDEEDNDNDHNNNNNDDDSDSDDDDDDAEEPTTAKDVDPFANFEEGFENLPQDTIDFVRFFFTKTVDSLI